MLFEKLVDQHRVHLIIAYAVWLSVLVMHHQVRIDLFHILRDESELLCAGRINLLLVSKGNRFQPEECFTDFIHRLDVLLETLRGWSHAKLTENVYDDCRGGNRYATDSTDKGAYLAVTDANSICLTTRPACADARIEVAGTKISERQPTYRCMKSAAGEARRALCPSAVFPPG